MPTKPEILSESLKSAVKETSVPALMLLKVIKNYHDAISAHKRDMTTNQAILRASKKEHEAHEAHIKRHEEMLAEYDAHLKRLSEVDWTGAPGAPGEPGAPGLPGETPDTESIISEVISRLPVLEPGKNGDPGKDADPEKVVRLVIEVLQKEKSLDISHIKGAQEFIKNGITYKTEELMHGGGVKSYDISNQIGSNVTTFTLPAMSAPANWKIYLDGARSRMPGDYTIAGSVLTTTFPPTTSIICDL